MKNTEVKKLLIDVPVVMCRNMNQQLITVILKDLPYNLSQHNFAVLRLLYEKNKLTITDIVNALSIKKAQMTASADQLLELGLISRNNDRDDRRKIYLSITPRGTEVISNINQKIEKTIEEVFTELTETEIQRLYEGLKELRKVCHMFMVKGNKS